jgi:hypothetical protein
MLSAYVNQSAEQTPYQPGHRIARRVNDIQQFIAAIDSRLLCGKGATEGAKTVDEDQDELIKKLSTMTAKPKRNEEINSAVGK